jgi:hypothetical protein
MDIDWRASGLRGTSSREKERLGLAAGKQAGRQRVTVMLSSVLINKVLTLTLTRWPGEGVLQCLSSFWQRQRSLVHSDPITLCASSPPWRFPTLSRLARSGPAGLGQG